MAVDNYTQQKAGGFVDRLALKKRELMYHLFSTEFPTASLAHVLDVGITADKHALSSNYFEKYFPDKHKIIALSNQPGTFLEEIYPGLTFYQGDARSLPFEDDSIDVVFSSAVIEHIGHYKQQQKMLAECFRVAKRGLFITTPNRWHPIEVHTLLPLLHWLPKSQHRLILKKLGLSFYADENNLNLLDHQTLITMCRELGIADFDFKFIKTFGFISNIILIARKSQS
ncbi:MAG: methyltransferase domain-containing protein [Gammaproteobacteria bacterium]|nr:methyltransferase domain-containing protein [Gammaproteobacteria bacterium]